MEDMEKQMQRLQNKLSLSLAGGGSGGGGRGNGGGGGGGVATPAHTPAKRARPSEVTVTGSTALSKATAGKRTWAMRAAAEKLKFKGADAGAGACLFCGESGDSAEAHRLSACPKIKQAQKDEFFETANELAAQKKEEA